MEIGTAAPTPAERATIPHHLVGIIPPDEPFSLATYQELALAAIADILARGKQPLLVGGTGQYLAAILEGWRIPRVPPHPALRANLEAEAQHHGAAALHSRLAHVDPAAAAAIPSNNVRRVIRALEVYLVTGTPISTLQTRQPPPFTLRTTWLQRDRTDLYARIDARVELMLAAGLLAEVTTLRAQGYAWELPAMSGLGYLQFRPYLEGQTTREAAVQRLKYDTHAFARGQESWFRRLPNVTLIAPPPPAQPPVDS